MSTLIDFFERKIPQPTGLGLRPIGKKYWEIRSDIRIRILFSIEGDLVSFYFVGNHDQIRRFIRS